MTRADRCPGVLRPHLAQDGAVVRIRIPGGQTTGASIGRLSRIAQEFGSADLQLTSRAGVQLRGLPAPLPASLVDAVRDAGFLPSDTHERVRNIVASPLTGIRGGAVDVRPLVVRLDAGLCAEPELANLPGRFLFTVDDGRGDVTGTFFDLGYRAVDQDHGWVLIGGASGIAVSEADAADLMLDLAHQFLAASQRAAGAWHVRDLPEWVRSLHGVHTTELSHLTTGTPLGAIGGAASVQVPLASLTPAQAATVEVAATGPVVITPSRGLVVSGAARRLPSFVEAGLIDDPDSPWSAISACVGAPSCQKSLINTRDYATVLAQSRSFLQRTHVSGCERRCGAPASAHIDLVAPAASNLLAVAGEAR
ncbi:MAG TPA: precorrin-3B synthase [Propionibacteriaceae bacterium]|nr:precorrin-3B synthase [Propionibacteriaceae bacterium]